ncbi:toll/interleukin-1 receptor domain-containing protein [Streptomyces rochei]|uniref:toll/interleukin-1 receptor domain-containing protein n=1 Tax=Streptomyces rochei TaxID=1928 RepID=UPI0037A6C78A
MSPYELPKLGQETRKRGTALDERHYTYDAFISYSHQRDVPLAEALRRGLRKLARHPYTRRRKVKIFRDTTSLAATSDLGGTIKAALAASRFFIYLASPEAAASRWVREEIAYWRKNHSMDQFVIALSAGSIAWDEQEGDFDWSRTTALPIELSGAFANQPLWVDFRDFRDSEDHSMAPGSPFRDKVVSVGAPLHNLSKDELDSEDRHLERTWKRIRASLIGTAAVGVVGFSWAGVYALQKSDEADARARTSASQALAARSLEVAASDPRKAAQFALYAHAVEATGEAAQALGRAVAANDSATQHLQVGNEEVAAFHGIGHVAATKVAVSRNGSVMAYYSDLDPDVMDGGGQFVHLYDIRARKALPSLRGKGWPQDGGGMAFSWDGRLLAIETPYNQVELWDVPRQKMIQIITASRGDDLAGAFNSLRAFAFSGDGKRLAAAFYTPAEEGEEYSFHLAVWDAVTGRLVSKEEATPDAISLAFNDKHELLALDSKAGTTRVLEPESKDWNTPRKIAGFPAADDLYVTLSDNGTLAYLERSHGEKDEVWDLIRGKRLAASQNGEGLDYPMMTGESSSRLITMNEREVILYDTVSRRRRTLGAFSFPVHTIAASGDGTWVAAGSSDGAVSLLSTSSFQSGAALPNRQHVKAAELTPDKRVAFRSRPDGTDLWTISEKGVQSLGRIPLRLVNKPTRQDSVIAGVDGTRVVVAQEGEVSLWDPRTGRRSSSPMDADHTFKPVSFLADGHHIIATKEEELQVIDPHSWRVRQSVPLKGSSLDVTAVSADRRTVAVLQNEELSVWRYREGKGLEQVQKVTVEGAGTFEQSATVSRRGEKVAIVNEDNRLFVLDVASGRIVRSAAVSPTGQMAAAFSSDNKFLVQAYGTGSDAGLQFWDTTSGEARGTWSYQDQSNRVEALADVFAAPDGSVLAFKGDGSLVRHTINISAWRDILCQLAPEPLPTAEYNRYLKDMEVPAPCDKLRSR